METTPVTPPNLFELSVDETASGYLNDAARWGKFLAIVGFCFCALIVLMALFAGSFLTSLSYFAGGFNGFGWLLSVYYILIGAVEFFPCLYLYRFALKAQTAVREQDSASLTTSMKDMRNMFRFVGILTIVFLGLMVLGIIFGIIGAMAARRY